MIFRTEMPKGRAQYFFSAAALAILLTRAIQQLIRFFPPPGADLNGDAYWTYLPSARKLLAHPWTFLTTDPDSYHVAPLGYFWPALWGADPVRIQLANCVLFLACVLLMWRAATRLGGWVAGVISVGLLVLHPDLTSYIPQVLTESIFLFGLMLFTTGSVEYALNKPRSSLWLGLAALGLTITLLSRPVFQIFTVASLCAGWGLMALCAWRRPRPNSAIASLAGVLNRRVCAALLAALLLPVMVAVKNGLSFDVWSVGTGAGTGLYYGVSPFKMGLEPVYSGFEYDAGITPLTVSPETKGHPLAAESDRINRRVAIDIVKNTSLADKAAFFTHKLKAWLLYSTPELHLASKLRTLRTFEWLTIALAALLLISAAVRRPSPSSAHWSTLPALERQKRAVWSILLLGVFAMALQLTPVLYNTRYNAFFMEPWLMLLTGVAASLLLRLPVSLEARALNPHPRLRWTSWLLGRALIVLVLVSVPIALTRYALRHETWGMDPYRPGPVAILLDHPALASIQGEDASSVGNNRWNLTASPASLRLSLKVSDPGVLTPEKVKDAIWRLRFSVVAPEGTARSACRRATLAVSPAYTSSGYKPEPVLILKTDGTMHTYAIHGNDKLRPAGSGELSITYHCPPGTIVTWGGAELLKSTIPEAARALIHENRPIDPYLRREP